MRATTADDFFADLMTPRHNTVRVLPGIGNEASAYAAVSDRIIRAGGTPADVSREWERLFTEPDAGETGASSSLPARLWVAGGAVALGVYASFLLANADMLGRLFTTAARFVRF